MTVRYPDAVAVVAVKSWSGMSTDFERASHYRPSAFPCKTCEAPADKQDLVRAPTGYVWRCRRCNSQSSELLPFDPRLAPSGKTEILLAIETLSVYVPILQKIDPDLIYRIVRPYFDAGWCVRDVLYAINYLPNGDTHPGQGAAWVRGEHRDRTLWRMQQRLRTWRFSDKEDGQDIMYGPYTATSSAMEQVAESQKRRATMRTVEWHEQAEAAKQAHHSGAKEVARRQAAIAARLARQRKSVADQMEREQVLRDIKRGRAASSARSASIVHEDID
ncbi:hypothetical protein [Micromonospora andamanensis]|uniref:Transposase n=1 Tax=Micromonospora andamanensis TaxID=1287068 RepID=A0ABQ4I5J6_9ACTN|nr:hypothetical protein [Micromonospora andamanensis]GIJ13137.1 hypothetical protein Van01_63510 [Micromonospora andamanensis]